MCSLAAVLLEDIASEPIAEMYQLVKPDGWTVPDEAAAIHGLTTEILEEKGYPAAAILERFMREFYEEAALLVGYGIEYDLKLLRGELRRAAMPDRYGEKPNLCVMRQPTKPCNLPPTEAMMRTGRKWNKTPTRTEAYPI